MDKICVVLVEDEPAWIKIIRDFLNVDEDILLVGVTTNKEDAVALVKDIKVDVILMDINLSGNKTDGIQAAVEIREFCNAKIIMLTAFNESEVIIDSFVAGAVNYLNKDNIGRITELIKEVSKEKTPLEILLQDYHRLKRKEFLAVLSSAELEIFTLLEQGLTQREIASRLLKSTDTIKIQVTSILKKLNVHSVKEAIKKVNKLK